jgi:hypothetical protein
MNEFKEYIVLILGEYPDCWKETSHTVLAKSKQGAIAQACKELMEADKTCISATSINGVYKKMAVY